MRLKSIAFLFIQFFCTSLSAQMWQPLNKGSNWDINHLYSDTINDRLYCGDIFKWFDTLYAPYVAQWNGLNWAKLDGSVDGAAVAFCEYHDTLFVSGAFFTAGGLPSKFLSKWKNGQWFPMGNIANGAVTDFVIWNGDLYVAGYYDSIGGIKANGIAKYNGTTWSTVGDLYSYYGDGNHIGKVRLLDNKLYVNGPIEDSTGQVADFASWDGIQWKYYFNMFFGPFANGMPYIEYKGQIYATGLFYQADGNAGNDVEIFDGITFHDVGGGITMPGCCAQVTDAYVYHDKLYAVGIFDSAGGVPAQNIACWDGTKWCGLGSTFDNKIGAIISYHDTLYVSGGFITIDGDTVNYIAKWLGGDFVDTCSVSVGMPQINQSNFDFSIHPNPASSQLQITFSETRDEQQLKILNSVNQVVEQEEVSRSKSIILDVSDLAAGIYILQTYNENAGYHYQKFVKQ